MGYNEILTLVFLFILPAVYVAYDTRNERSMTRVIWTLVVIFTGVIGLLFYLINKGRAK